MITLAQSGGSDLERATDEAVPDRLDTEDWILAAAIVLAAAIAALVARRAVLAFGRRGESDLYAIRVLSRFITALIVTGGFLYALASLEIRLAPLLAGLGVLGIVIAFATKDLTANYVAGLLIGIRRPFRIGDEISSQGNDGVVEDLNFRYTTVRGFDNTKILLPNASVFSNPLVNLTANGYRRSEVSVGVAYDTDLELAARTLEETAAGCEGVLTEPPRSPGSMSSGNPRSC